MHAWTFGKSPLSKGGTLKIQIFAGVTTDKQEERFHTPAAYMWEYCRVAGISVAWGTCGHFRAAISRVLDS